MKYNKKHTYTVYELNNWPTGVQAVGIVSTLLWAMGTDIFGGRWLANYYLAFTAIVSATIILVPSTPTAGIFGAYYWAGSIYACQATSFAWANDVMKLEDHAFRAVIIGFMNFGGNTFNAFWPLIFYSTDQAPYFTVRLCHLVVMQAKTTQLTIVTAWNVLHDCYRSVASYLDYYYRSLFQENE